MKTQENRHNLDMTWIRGQTDYINQNVAMINYYFTTFNPQPPPDQDPGILTETLKETVRVRERLRFGEERSCERLNEEITKVSQVSAWVLCLHRGVVKKEERFSAEGRAVLCRRKSERFSAGGRVSGSLPMEEWFSAITKEWLLLGTEKIHIRYDGRIGLHIKEKIPPEGNLSSNHIREGIRASNPIILQAEGIPDSSQQDITPVDPQPPQQVDIALVKELLIFGTTNQTQNLKILHQVLKAQSKDQKNFSSTSPSKHKAKDRRIYPKVYIKLKAELRGYRTLYFWDLHKAAEMSIERKKIMQIYTELQKESVPQPRSSVVVHKLVHKITFKQAQDQEFFSCMSWAVYWMIESIFELIVHDDRGIIPDDQLYFQSFRNNVALGKDSSHLLWSSSLLFGGSEGIFISNKSRFSAYFRRKQKKSRFSAGFRRMQKEKYSDLSFEHETLKTSHIELETTFKELDTLACDMNSKEHYLKFEIASNKYKIEFLKEQVSALEKNKSSPLLKDFYKPTEPETFHEFSSKHVPFRPRKRHFHQNRLINPFSWS
ncbi:hypothetical protein M5K25_017950 [Dendrobium thyrsiflorum]|uniref:Uncharacterized protein n=1 Tax=Dendrobium thyrsiflorum TaxID=117978 RepID=A0ABD0UHE1_DENTH